LLRSSPSAAAPPAEITLAAAAGSSSSSSISRNTSGEARPQAPSSAVASGTRTLAGLRVDAGTPSGKGRGDTADAMALDRLAALGLQATNAVMLNIVLQPDPVSRAGADTATVLLALHDLVGTSISVPSSRNTLKFLQVRGGTGADVCVCVCVCVCEVGKGMCVAWRAFMACIAGCALH
jgi:hypothetical protein